MINGIELNQIYLLVIMAGAIVLLFTEWLRIDLTAILIIVALGLSGVLDAEGALSGFSSEPAIILAAMFVLSGALFHTGLSERLGNLIKRLAGGSFERIILVVMPAVALLSAFVGHVALTAIMLPIMLKISRENELAPSRLLIPMAFAASLGTAIALIGAPAFLVVNGLLAQAGQARLGIFSIAPIGLVLSLTGTLFFLFVGRFLLPDRQGSDDSVDHFRLDGYYTELVILPDSPLIGKTIREVEEQQPTDFKVSAWYRNKRPREKPFGTKKTQAGDVLVIRTNPDKLATIDKEPGIAIQPLEKYRETFSPSQESENAKDDLASRLVQAVVAPRSELIGKTIGRINFVENYSVIVVGVWRRKGWLRTELSRARLREGDVLVMTGDPDAIRRISEDRSFLLLVPFRGEPKPVYRARLAGLIMIVAILLAAMTVVPVEIAFLTGALVMILTGCISTAQAYQSIDVRIYIFIAGAIPLGLAMQETGTANLLAGWLQGLVSGWEIHWILLALFIVTGLVTQVMSDAGTTALFGPIAIALAQGLNLRPEPFVVTVAMAAVTSFFTPIGHHGNLLIYGPGRYQFGDFVRVGVPLTLIVAVIVSMMAPLLWPG
jgi:di/tricarboxylate transporter